MVVKELNQEKELKRVENKDLLKEIIELRSKLNKKIYKNGNRLAGADLLELSKQMDKLIVEYLDQN